ncbi:response regulator transcription factor [Labrys okinawensis]|uniref:response regulator transcription factor n=1 Tax=Labrys okinawensis TaxID=346911 RepID=UPI0039BD09CD
MRTFGYDVELYRSAGEFLKRRPDNNIPSCILLDAQMPGLSGPELQERLAKLGSTLPIVFLTGHGDIAMSVRAIKAGAEDFLTKPVPKDALLNAINHAMGTFSAVREREAQLRLLRVRVGTLTPREKEVYELVVQGKLNKQIAYELGTTERTIKAHRHKVMEKMQVRSLAELVSIAERLGTLSIARRASEDPLQTLKRQALAIAAAMESYAYD